MDGKEKIVDSGFYAGLGIVGLGEPQAIGYEAYTAKAKTPRLSGDVQEVMTDGGFPARNVNDLNAAPPDVLKEALDLGCGKVFGTVVCLDSLRVVAEEAPFIAGVAYVDVNTRG